MTHTLASHNSWLIVSHSVKSISWPVQVSCPILSRNQSKPIKQVMCPSGVTCVKPMAHNYESCARYINHMTTIVRHVKYQPITMNQWHAIASSCKILWVNWSHSVKDNKSMTNNYYSCESLPCLVTVCDTYLWTLVATQPYIPCFRTQLTTPSSLPIHYSFIQPPEYHLSISRYGFPAIPLDWKESTLGTNDWVSEEATICFILILRSG